MGIIFKENYTVQVSDIDVNNHMNNIRYIEWVQEISKNHWLDLVTPHGYHEHYFWVILNHNITYRASSHVGDKLEIETFVEKFEGVYSYRRVNIFNKTKGKMSMTALTKWCLIDAKTERITRIPKAFEDLLSDD